MDIKRRAVGDVVILEVPNEFERTENAIRSIVQDLLKKGHRRFLLNLASCRHLHTSGIGEFVHCLHAIKEYAGGELKFSDLQLEAREKLTRLSLLNPQFFEAYDTEAEALASFDVDPSDKAD